MMVISWHENMHSRLTTSKRCCASNNNCWLCSPLLQRFPTQHMESLVQRFRLLRQGRQTPRASLQNSSPPQSSSSVQTPDCYNKIKKIKTACHLKYWDVVYETYINKTSAVAHRLHFHARETFFTCKVSTGDLWATLPEGEVRGLGLTVSATLAPEAPGKFLIALEFIRTVPA